MGKKCNCCMPDHRVTLVTQTTEASLSATDVKPSVNKIRLISDQKESKSKTKLLYSRSGHQSHMFHSEQDFGLVLREETIPGWPQFALLPSRTTTAQACVVPLSPWKKQPEGLTTIEYKCQFLPALCTGLQRCGEVCQLLLASDRPGSSSSSPLLAPDTQQTLEILKT